MQSVPVCLHQTAAKCCLAAHPLSAAPGRVQAEEANAYPISLLAPGCSGLVIKGEYAMLGSRSQPRGGVGPQRLKKEGCEKQRCISLGWWSRRFD